MPELYQLVTAMIATHFENLEKSFGVTEIKKSEEKLEESEGWEMSWNF